MMNREDGRSHFFNVNKLVGLTIIVLAGILLFDWPFAAANENSSCSIGLFSCAETKTSANALDQDSRKKKKKKKDDDDGKKVIGVRPPPPFSVPPAIPGKRYVYFIAFGDWGTGNSDQRHVAGLMSKKAGRDSLHFVLSLGDNFYSSGVTSVDDPQWQEKFETIYDLPFLKVPFFATLGNHDYRKNANPDAQVEYSKRNTRWRMPARYYTFTRPLAANASIQFFALDTEALNLKDSRNLANAQVEWLDKALAQSPATWKVVFGHHPVFSNGEHGNTPAMQEWIRPLLEKHRVDFYLCGHDHDRQFLQPLKGVHYIVSGTGAKSRNTVWADNTIFAATDLGFTWCRVSAEEFHVQFINKSGEIEFAHTVTKAEQRSSSK